LYDVKSCADCIVRCAPLDVDQFLPLTAAAAGTSRDQETDVVDVDDDDDELSAVVELNDETGAFEYTLYSALDPPKIRLYVPGNKPSSDARIIHGHIGFYGGYPRKTSVSRLPR